MYLQLMQKEHEKDYLPAALLLRDMFTMRIFHSLGPISDSQIFFLILKQPAGMPKHAHCCTAFMPPRKKHC